LANCINLETTPYSINYMKYMDKDLKNPEEFITHLGKIEGQTDT
jgi:hypothetical protein